ncbi:MAG: hypothetical protein K1W13_08700 [Lachnospiraceae bacterium]
MEKEREGAAKVGKDFQSTLFVFAGFELCVGIYPTYNDNSIAFPYSGAENKKFDADEPLPIVYNSGEAI